AAGGDRAGRAARPAAPCAAAPPHRGARAPQTPAAPDAGRARGCGAGGRRGGLRLSPPAPRPGLSRSWGGWRPGEPGVRVPGAAEARSAVAPSLPPLVSSSLQRRRLGARISSPGTWLSAPAFGAQAQSGAVSAVRVRDLSARPARAPQGCLRHGLRCPRGRIWWQPHSLARRYPPSPWGRLPLSGRKEVCLPLQGRGVNLPPGRLPTRPGLSSLFRLRSYGHRWTATVQLCLRRPLFPLRVSDSTLVRERSPMWSRSLQMGTLRVKPVCR
ncbi:PREDICTED: translation initiation factor IF-2-like, partial [Chinchilla lanigera]|uniref:translation initiation factor IF-2-like n=1 Tax=Chinchilla lanigera TaxID=34839 RepID=UPI0006972874